MWGGAFAVGKLSRDSRGQTRVVTGFLFFLPLLIQMARHRFERGDMCFSSHSGKPPLRERSAVLMSSSQSRLRKGKKKNLNKRALF